MVVVFDGMCNLCDFAVQFILRYEANADLRFCPMQTQTGRMLMERHGVNPDDPSTFVLVEGDRIWTKSSAALRVATYLRRPWSWLAVLRYLPATLRDAVYDFIARHRYRWFGRRDQCVVPAAGLQRRFLQDD